MKISVMTFVFGEMLSRDGMTDVALLDALKDMGLEGVELPAGYLLSEPTRLETYRSYLADSGLEVTCIDAAANFVAEEAAQRKEGIDALKAGIELAQSLECRLVLAAGSRLTGRITPAEGRKMTADGLNACMPLAQEAGVTLAIENFGVAPTLQCASADCIEVMEGAPGTAFVFDTGNFYFASENPLANFAALAGRTCHVHVKDWIKSNEPQIADVAGAALGEGIIPNQEVVTRFIESTDVDSFSLEVGAPGDTLEATRRDLATLRRWLG